MIMIIIAMRSGRASTLILSLRRHDIAHIASSVYLASSGAGFFLPFFNRFRLQQIRLPICRFIPSKFLNRGMSFYAFLFCPQD